MTIVRQSVTVRLGRLVNTGVILCVCVRVCTIDLNVYKARGDDAAFTVHTLVGETLLIKEQLLWI